MSELLWKIVKWALLLVLLAVLVYFMVKHLVPGRGGWIDTFFQASDQAAANVPKP